MREVKAALPTAVEWDAMTEQQRTERVKVLTSESLRIDGRLVTPPPVSRRAPSHRPAALPPRPWPSIVRRNLLFYLLPLRNPAKVWQWHVKQLRKHLSLFNGQRIVAIGTEGELLESPSKVKKEFGSDSKRIRFIELPNDSKTWEAPAMRKMLRLVKSTRPDEASFYFHAKGVRRIEQTAVRLWCEAIYKALLSDTALESLRHAKACGASLRPADPSGLRTDSGSWHFAGNAWWVRHDALFGAKNWERSLGEDNPWSAEAYLPTRFDRGEVVDLCQTAGDVYDPASWASAEPRRVSVIVTGRNYGRYLRDCLESCLNQDRRSEEVIYCDDASQDDSLEIARRFGAVKVVSLKRNVGVVKARNHAASQATGNALLFVDADNLLPRNYLSALLGTLNHRTPFVYGDQAYFGTSTGYARQPEWKQADLWQGQFVDTCSLIRREVFDAVGGWVDDKEGTRWSAMEDYHLFLRLSLYGAAKRANVALGYRKHEQSLTAATGRDGNAHMLRLWQKKIREDVERWAVKRFGRLPSRAERDDGVLLS